jgi:hypothetical protein
LFVQQSTTTVEDEVDDEEKRGKGVGGRRIGEIKQEGRRSAANGPQQGGGDGEGSGQMDGKKMQEILQETEDEKEEEGRGGKREGRTAKVLMMDTTIHWRNCRTSGGGGEGQKQ